MHIHVDVYVCCIKFGLHHIGKKNQFRCLLFQAIAWKTALRITGSATIVGEIILTWTTVRRADFKFSLLKLPSY